MDATVAVESVESVGPDTYAIEFASPEGFEAQPGQFVKLRADVEGEGYARFYTLSSPGVEDTFELTIEVSEEGGPFSAHLANLAASDEIEMSGPFGNDYYEGEARVVVLAGGPGVGPAVGIGERALADGAEVAVVYKDEDPAHVERLNDIEERGATVYITDSSIEDFVDATVTGAGTEQVFVYGFAEFIEEATAAIEDAGGEVDGAKIENFG
jgi:ferredoxin-NADP reductase